MREFLVVIAAGLLLAFLIDHYWFDGRNLGAIRHDGGLSISSSKRH